MAAIFVLGSPVRLRAAEAPAAAAPEKESPATLKYELAQRLHFEELYAMAAVQYEEFLDDYPDDPRRADALYVLADCRFQQEEFKEAATRYEEFCRDNDGSRYYAIALSRLGYCRLMLDDNDAAIAALLRLEELSPAAKFLAQTNYRLGRAYHKKADYERALANFGLVIAEPEAGGKLLGLALFWAGDALERTGQFARAAESYQRLLEELPDDTLKAETTFRLAQCYQQLGQHDKAIETFTLAEADAQFAEPALYGGAVSFLQLKKYENAAKLFEEYAENFPAAPSMQDAMLKTCWCYYYLGEAQRMTRIKACLAFLQSFPDSADEGEVHFLLADAYASVGQLDNALASFQAVPESSQYYSQARFRLALTHHRARDLPAAADAYDDLLEKFPQHEHAADALMQAGLIHFHLAGAIEDATRQQAAYAKAESRFEEFLKRFANHEQAPTMLFAKGESERLQGKDARMAATFEQYASIENAPRKSTALFWVGRYRQMQGDKLRLEAEAADARDERTAEDGEDAAENAQSEKTSRELYRDALAWYQRAIDAYDQSFAHEGPGVIEAHLRLAEAAYAAGLARDVEAGYLSEEAGEARRRSNQRAALSLDQQAADLSKAAGGSLDSAATHYAVVIANAPELVDDQRVYMWTAARFRSGEKHTDAIRVYVALLERWPDSDARHRALCELGLIHAELPDPDWAASYAYFDQLLVDYARMDAEEPATPRPLETLARYGKAVALKNTGRLEEAKEQLQKIVRDVPSGEMLNVRAQVELGEVLVSRAEAMAAAGDPLGAKAGYAEARRMFLNTGIMFDDPKLSPRSLFWIGYCSFLMQEEQEAIKTWAKLLKRYAGSDWTERAREELEQRGIVVTADGKIVH